MTIITAMKCDVCSVLREQSESAKAWSPTEEQQELLAHFGLRVLHLCSTACEGQVYPALRTVRDLQQEFSEKAGEEAK